MLEQEEILTMSVDLLEPRRDARHSPCAFSAKYALDRKQWKLAAERKTPRVIKTNWTTPCVEAWKPVAGSHS